MSTHIFQSLQVQRFVDIESFKPLIFIHLKVNESLDKLFELLLAVADHYICTPDNQLGACIGVTSDVTGYTASLLQKAKRVQNTLSKGWGLYSANLQSFVVVLMHKCSKKGYATIIT